MPFDTAGFAANDDLLALQRVRHRVMQGQWCKGGCDPNGARCLLGWLLRESPLRWPILIQRYVGPELPKHLVWFYNNYHMATISYNDGWLTRKKHIVRLLDRAIRRAEQCASTDGVR